MMVGGQVLKAQGDGDLERRIGEDIDLEGTSVVETTRVDLDDKTRLRDYFFGLTELVYRDMGYFLGKITRKAGEVGAKVGKAAGRGGLYMVGGGLPTKYQLALEERFGSEYYDANNASFVHLLVTTPLIYGGATAYTLSSMGRSAEEVIGWGLGAASISIVANFFARGAYSEITNKSPPGDPLFSLLMAPAVMGRGIWNWSKGKAQHYHQGAKEIAKEKIHGKKI